jgi:hypothetical protein
LTGLDRSSKRKFSLRNNRFDLDATMRRALMVMGLIFAATAVYEILKAVL